MQDHQDIDYQDNDYLTIGRQFGVFLRRSDRFFFELKGAQGFDLDRAAFMLLGRIVGGGPARLSALADDLTLDLSTVSRQVATLESAGLVARTTDAADRRVSVIAATPSGQDAFARNRAIWQAALHDLLADWTPAERSEFARLFTRLNDKIAAHADEKRQENTQ